MLLPPHELEQFFRLHRSLLFFVNQRLTVIPNKLNTPEEFAALSPNVRLKVRDALSANLDQNEFIKSCGLQLWSNALILEGAQEEPQSLVHRIQSFMEEAAEKRSPIVFE